MMMIKNKLIWMLGLSIALTSCDSDNELPEIEAEQIEAEEIVALNSGTADFSKYVAVGASFTAGFTDGALFIAAQENSFPNTLAQKFAMAGGGEFIQPLMDDNIGGFLLGGQEDPLARFEPRLFFNGAGPTRLDATPTTEATTSIASNYNNFGIPGAKSFHLTFPGYATLNPYFGRMATSPTITVVESALAQNPTFFTLSEVGGNDVLGYATDGGTGLDQTGNPDASTYGANDITDPGLFGVVLKSMTDALTANGAKGVVSNVPYITSLAHFTTVPYNPLDPTDLDTGLADQIPLLNQVFGAINLIYTGAGEPERSIVFSTTETNPLVIFDEDATDLTTAITATLSQSATFIPFVESLGLPAAAAPTVAQLLGAQYGKARSATEEDLFVLPSMSIIGEVDFDVLTALVTQSGGLLPTSLAGQFSAQGITLPLADKWVLTPQEQEAIRTATDLYNQTMVTITNDNPNIALVDLNSVLETAAISGLPFDDFNLTTALVRGGLISLDGVHLTARGYALMANEMLKVIDTSFGSNFGEATNGLAEANDFPTNYSPGLANPTEE